MKYSHSTIFELQNPIREGVEEHIASIISNFENNPDYFELIATEKQSIGIKETRDMINWLQLKPYQEKNKLAIIQEAEKLTLEAQNSLLKSLEEPPEHSFIFLLASNHKRLLQTIISRSQLIRISEEKSLIIDDFADSAKRLLEGTTEQKINFIDEIARIKDPKEKKDKIHDFLEESHKILISQKGECKYNNLKLLSTTLEALERNVNKKLLLENFLFNLEIC